MVVVRFFRRPGVSLSDANKIRNVPLGGGLQLLDLQTEHCFNVELSSENDADLTEQDRAVLSWLLSETFESTNFASQSFLVRLPRG
jgi:hypothetical protein